MELVHPTKLVLELVNQIPERHKDILVKRYGLLNGERRTLEDVGNDYNITRERVRQIEEAGFSYLRKLEQAKHLEPFFDTLYFHLSSHGDLRHEEKLLISDASEIFSFKENDNKFNSAVYFILTFGDKFHRFAQTPKYHSVWTINKKTFIKAKNILDKTVSILQKQKKVVSKNELLEILESVAKKYFQEVNEKILHSYLELSKEISSNIFGEYGLRFWPEINPKSMRERAYLVLKKENKPLHFRDITELINKMNLSSKTAYETTVHNDLIRDEKFVLCGRGLYALREWGYSDGTVKDLITELLKIANQPKSKDEIIEYVMKQRQVKPGTVLFNLQDKNLFKKNSDGWYGLNS